MAEELTFPSPDAFAAGSGLPPEMLRDLLAVAAVEAAAIEGFVHALRQETGVLAEQRLAELAGRFFNDDAVAESVVRTLQNVPPKFKQNVLALVDRWRRVSDERRKVFADAKFEALRRNLELLVQDLPSLSLMRKAQRLLRDTGNEFQDAVVICDLRPVFDESQKRVEGFVALSNLRNPIYPSKRSTRRL